MYIIIIIIIIIVIILKNKKIKNNFTYNIRQFRSSKFKLFI